MLAELRDLVDMLRDIHDQMKRRMKPSADFRALIAVEKSMTLLSHVAAASAASNSGHSADSVRSIAPPMRSFS